MFFRGDTSRETLSKCGYDFESDLRQRRWQLPQEAFHFFLCDPNPISELTGVELMSSIFEWKPLRV